MFSGAGLSPKVEHHNSRRRSDLEVKAWVFEFKVCGPGKDGKEILEEAILQLQRKEYGLQELEEKCLVLKKVDS
ncbi:PD-(D/E)XK nuclease domain-containing protein [Parasutterella excrementihominis]|uniref:PD-(D/E)XK nuclease domain-containing protein n=1 Tax=Parasutterella excrementihominis TaxID=487175 RepID=UPI00352118CF